MKYLQNPEVAGNCWTSKIWKKSDIKRIIITVIVSVNNSFFLSIVETLSVSGLNTNTSELLPREALFLATF